MSLILKRILSIILSLNMALSAVPAVVPTEQAEDPEAAPAVQNNVSLCGDPFCTACGGAALTENSAESGMRLPAVHRAAEVLLTEAEEPHVHADLYHQEAVSPTCISYGSLEYWICPGCGGWFLDEACTQATTPADVILDYGPHEILPRTPAEATCTEAGTDGTYICIRCFKSFLDREATQPAAVFPALGHIKGDKTEAVPATCTSEGNIDYWYCERCNQYFLDEDYTTAVAAEDIVTDRLPHTMTETPAAEPSCTEPGNSAYWFCSACRQYFSDAEGTAVITDLADTVIPAKGHSGKYVEATEPGCLTDGNIAYWCCEGCGGCFADEACEEPIEPAGTVLAATGHPSLEKVAARASTCSVQGNSQYYSCPACGRCYADEEGTIEGAATDFLLPLKEHDREKLAHVEAVASNCLRTGNVEHWICGDCHQYFLDAECTVPTTAEAVITTGGHSMTEMPAAEPSCTEPGNSACWYCSICEKYFSDEAGTEETTPEACARSPLGHDPGEVAAVEVSCTADGNIRYYICGRCGGWFFDRACTEEIEDETAVLIRHTGHQEQVAEGYAATCEEPGLTDGVICAVCRTPLVPQEEIPATGHTPVTVKAVAATYTSTGLTAGTKCSTCNDILKAQETVPMLTIPKPSFKSLSRTVDGIKLVWTATSHTDVYQVLRGTVSKAGSMKVIGTVTGTEYLDTTAKTGTKYYYRVRSCTQLEDKVVNQSIESGYKALVVVKAPKTISTALNSTGITVTFASVSGATSYIVQRKDGTAGWKTVEAKFTDSGSGKMSFQDKNLTTGTAYRYRVKAMLEQDEHSYYSAYNMAAARVMIAAPKSVKTAIQTTGIKVSWGKVTGATGYILQKKVGTGSWKTLKTITDASTVSHLCTGLTSGSKYSFRVYSYVDSDSSKSVASSTVVRYYMKRPTISSAGSSAKGKLTLKWTRDTKATGYEIRYSTSSSFPSDTTKTGSYTGTSATVTKTLSSLKSGKTYYAQIRSYITVSGKKYYSAWSKTQQAKVK